VELSFPIGQAPDEIKYDNDTYFRDRETELASKSFVLRGSGWPSQDNKRKTQMTRKNLEAGQRTQKTWGKPKRVLPNYKGKLTDSWDDAKKMAKKNEN